MQKQDFKIIAIDISFLKLGDITLAIKALYALSVLYPKSKIVVFTSKLGARLFQNYNFLHQIVVIGGSTDKEKSLFNALIKEKIDILLIAFRKSWRIRAAKLSKIPKVISFVSLESLFLKRFQSPFYYKRGGGCILVSKF